MVRSIYLPYASRTAASSESFSEPYKTIFRWLDPRRATPDVPHTIIRNRTIIRWTLSALIPMIRFS